jgi:serine/threonine protein kinase HipA of HipAB toxin-antitoxin module
LRQLHSSAEEPAGEGDEQDTPEDAAASGESEAPENTERQIEKNVCNEVAAARRFSPAPYEISQRADAAFGLIEGERVERTVKDDGDDDRRRNQEAFVESVCAARNRWPI